MFLMAILFSEVSILQKLYYPLALEFFLLLMSCLPILGDGGTNTDVLLKCEHTVYYSHNVGQFIYLSAASWLLTKAAFLSKAESILSLWVQI